MQIKIGEKYQVRSDANSFILEAKKEVKDGDNKGKVYWDVIGYYPSLELSLQKCVDAHIKRSDADSVGKLLEEVQELKQDISTALKPLRIYVA